MTALKYKPRNDSSKLDLPDRCQVGAIGGRWTGGCNEFGHKGVGAEQLGPQHADSVNMIVSPIKTWKYDVKPFKFFPLILIDKLV